MNKAGRKHHTKKCWRKERIEQMNKFFLISRGLRASMVDRSRCGFCEGSIIIRVYGFRKSNTIKFLHKHRRKSEISGNLRDLRKGSSYPLGLNVTQERPFVSIICIPYLALSNVSCHCRVVNLLSDFTINPHDAPHQLISPRKEQWIIREKEKFE